MHGRQAAREEVYSRLKYSAKLKTSFENIGEYYGGWVMLTLSNAISILLGDAVPLRIISRGAS